MECWRRLRRLDRTPVWTLLNGGQKGKGPSMQDLMDAMNNTHMNLNANFCQLQLEIKGIRQEMSMLRDNMVTKQEFESLEARVAKLEKQGTGMKGGEIKTLRFRSLDSTRPTRRYESENVKKSRLANVRTSSRK